MALQKFTRAILAGEKTRVFNYGKHRRDFTYIDDIVERVIRVLDRPVPPTQSGAEPTPTQEAVRLSGESTISATTQSR